ncbi:hypothetical protein AVEN_65068-1 [Araneus ventricosus]|uniref:Uncharacterized protein n=1 Tax=Araneus ventricosus TaxID=182803 RepID=A0A4Y2MEV5_ARAVE|nr:hypothetical protein AVEN_65068-1 [Araneus ventricosus]
MAQQPLQLKYSRTTHHRVVGPIKFSTISIRDRNCIYMCEFPIGKLSSEKMPVNTYISDQILTQIGYTFSYTDLNGSGRREDTGSVSDEFDERPGKKTMSSATRRIEIGL